jgi:ankyrin repeat protein
MIDPDAPLRRLVDAIVTGNAAEISRILTENSSLAKASFQSTNATRQTAKQNFIASVGRYIYRGDTALHFASAAYETKAIQALIALGADVRAKNRLGDEPLHAAATGNPVSNRFNPKAQSTAIKLLVEAGADPNTTNKLGVSPLHKAVRTRCAAAVQTLLASGADPAKKNKRGSDGMLLARLNTGRGGSGSLEAKEQQLKILKSLENARAAG